MIDGNPYLVADLQGKIIWRNDTGTGHQKTTLGKVTFPKQKRHQVGVLPFHLANGDTI